MSKFITFEGGEGSGKSTQAKKLHEYINSTGGKAHLTREPGGTDLAERLRNEILLKNGGVEDPLTEFLIITAARRDHVENVIKSKLKAGYTVICDRFYDSSLAYQSYYKGLDINVMEQLHRIALGGFQPDVTFFLDMDIEKANRRVDLRGEKNHYDEKGVEFNRVILGAFRDIAIKNPTRIITIDAHQNIDTVFESICSKIAKK